MLDRVLLVTCIAIVAGSLIYFFFWNRILGSLLGIIIRISFWTQDNSAAWVDIGSAHLSLISGRLLLRDLRYHSSNQTFRVVKCQFSWRWWIRNVAEEEDLADNLSDGVESSSSRKHHPQCRIHISMEGFEWFMYNRTASFDNILSQLSASNTEVEGMRTKTRDSNVHSTTRSVLVRDDARSQASIYVVGRRALSFLRFPLFVDKLTTWVNRQLPDLDPKNLLPVSFEAVKGAITLGNHTTESLLLVQFAQASGTYGIVQSRSKLDYYKQLLRIAFKAPSISCIENPDYWTDAQSIGERVRQTFAQADPIFNLRIVPLAYDDFRKLWSRCRRQFPFFKSRGRRYIRSEKDEKKKEKGKKAREEISHVGADFTTLEYAIDRKLLEAPTLDLVYYADVAGKVSNRPVLNSGRDTYSGTGNKKGIEFLDIGNGDLPPEWGVDVVVHGGAIHYGPWADRQRIQLQRVFFPQIFQSSEPTSFLSPGDQRLCTCLKIFFEFRDATTVHVPFREASKNWQWDGLVEVPRTRKQREAASIQMRMGEKSSVKYLVPMISTAHGYIAGLDIFMDSIQVTSSLNDIRLLEAESCSISSFLPSPLQWNRERSWDFNVSLDRPVLYIIRDHVNMLTDLGKDWASGPPSNFNTFVPIIYSLNLNFHDFELNLYANDHNIIDRPLDSRENVLFTVKGDVLKNTTLIPSNIFRPLSSTVSFTLSIPDIGLILSLPRWNTHGLSSTHAELLRTIGRVKLFQLDGSYTYHSEVRSDCIDRLKLDIKIPSPSLKLFGWIIRHVMVLRENYFGGFTQYSTTREYLSKREKGIPTGDPIDLKYRPGKSNVFHFDLALLVTNATFALPAGVLGFETVRNKGLGEADMGSSVVLYISELQLQLRLHDSFMEMSLNLDPVLISIVDSCPDRILLSHIPVSTNRQMYISGIQITANRLFGPQPHTATYVCIWNISLGKVKGSLTTIEGQTLLAAGKSFSQAFSDPFNAPAAEFTVVADRDATFLNVTIEGLELVWRNTPAVVRLSVMKGLRVALNNVAKTRYRKLTSVVLPHIEIQMLLAQNTAKQWLEAGRIQTGISLDLYSAPSGWCKDAEQQKEFLTKQDAQTHRFARVINPKGQYNTPRWSNDLYLQSIHAPRITLSSNNKERQVSPNVLLSADWPMRSKLVESESDDDLLVSEVDRDERLANSRPNSSAHPLDVKRDNHSTTSFDESDETDGGGSENSWSDYFEFGAEMNGTGSQFPYWRFCRKLQMRRTLAGTEYQSEFIVRKEVPKFQERLFVEDMEPILAEDASLALIPSGQIGRDVSDTESKNYNFIDVKSTSIFLTPLCATSLKEMLDLHNTDERSPELQLDALMLERISGSTKASASMFSVRLRSVKLLIVHDTADLLKVQSNQGPLSEDSHAFVVADAGAEEIRCLLGFPSSGITSFGSASPSGSISARKIRGTIATLYASATPTKQYIRPPTVAIESNVDSLSITYVKSRPSISLYASSLRFCRNAPEVVLASFSALQTPINELSTAYKRYTSSSLLRRKQLVCAILAHGNSAISKDLLSSVQPAFFVQSGHPNILRSDSSWKLLFHLRHSLSDISEDEFESLKLDMKAVPKESEMIDLLQKRHVPWAMEEGLALIEVEFIESIFSKQTKRNTSGKEGLNDRPLASFKFQANLLRLVLDSGDASVQSSLSVRGVDICGDLLTRALIFDLNSMSPYSSTNRSIKRTDDFLGYGNSMTALVTMNMDSLQITIFPNIIEWLQNAIHVWRILSPPPAESSGDADHTPSTFMHDLFDSRVIALDIRFNLHHMLFETAAENIIFEVSSNHFSSCNVIHLSKPLETTSLDIGLNTTIGFDELSVKANTRSFADNGMDMLASLTTAGAVLCFLFQNHTPEGTGIRSTIHAASIELNIPRSAIRLYKFMEQWIQDYLLGIDSMMKSLFTEIKQTPQRSSKQLSMKQRDMNVTVNVSLASAAVVLQVMHGTWVAWTVYGIIGYIKDKVGIGGMARTCGLQVVSQTIRITSTITPGDWPSQRPPKIVLDLPSFTTSGSFNSDRIGLIVSIGFLRVSVKPSHWDSLLSVQQKFGQDFNDLLLILSDAKSKRPTSKSRNQTTTAEFTPLYVTAKFEGFKIGLEGLSSTQYLECVDIDAVISNKGSPQWRVTLTDLALYLSPRSLFKEKHAQPVRSLLPVLVSVDLHVASHRSTPGDQNRRLEIDITKFHAIFQAHLVGEIGDFVDYLQAELMLRKEQRAAELSDFKEKAMRVMKTFNLNPRKTSLVQQEKFLDNSIITISMENLGAAFPLNIERKKMTRFESEETVTKAFLLSIKSLKFQTQRGESGEALMNGFCCQFVSRFNPSNPVDFSSDRHHTLNQMLYPEMTARLRTKTTSSARRIFASASISGFILDLDPSITSHASSLVDAYRHGKQRVEQLTVGRPRSAGDIEAGATNPLDSIVKSSGENTVTSSVEASLKFMSGTVRMHCTSKDSSAFSSNSPDWQGKTYQILDSDAEVFNLPELSVSAEYNADAKCIRSESEEDLRSPVLIFRSTVHSSHNTLRPLVLSFVSGVVHNIEERMKVSHVDLHPPSSIRRSLSTITSDERDVRPGAQEPVPSSLQLFISLRIDKSRLEFTCKPDVNVVAGVNWESGGFILNMEPGAKSVSLSSSIEGLTIGLKHGFLSEDSAHIDAKNLNFSVNFTKISMPSGHFTNTISVVVDTEFSGGIRFSRLQDFLCFKAVWLDHIPVFNSEGIENASSPSKLSAVSSLDQAPKQGFDTAIVVRVRQILLEADLGQSISTVTFNLQTALIRTHLTSEFSELSISFARVDMQARGNLSGHLRMPDFTFRTVRMRQKVPEPGNQSLSRMLELNLTSGTLDIQLQSDWLWLLQYRAEPLEATIYDEWTVTDSSNTVKDRQLHLYFTVSGSKVIAMMTIMAIPKLLMYAGKFRSNMEAQREGASRESSAFRSTRLPKPDNALSEVANAMFQSARTKLKETESLSYAINQHMKLRLGELVFVVLPRSQGDNELARFIGRNVTAQLQRTMQEIGLPAHRELELSLSHMSISQLLKQGFDPRLPGQEFDVLTTSGRSFSGTENVIFSLPAMDMRMVTDEGTEDQSKILPYDFISNFVRREGQRGENINISFNIRLYSWLTILRKTFTRELKRAQEIADWRSTNVSPPNLTAPRLASPDNMPSSSFAFGMEDAYKSYSPPGSRPPSRPSSRPSSPVRSRSVDSVILTTPRKGSNSQSPVTLMSPKFGHPEASKEAEHPTGVTTHSPTSAGDATEKSPAQESPAKKHRGIIYSARSSKIERLTVKQLGEATPDVMHPFFTRKAGFNLEESLPQYVHEYATVPIEEIMKALVKLYSKQLN